MASLEVYKYVDTPKDDQGRIVTFHDFRRMFEEGMVDIVLLTGRQKLHFLTCLTDCDFTRNMSIASEKYKAKFCELRKSLPMVVHVLQEKSQYSQEQVDAAQTIAKWFAECNRRVLNIQKYDDFHRYLRG